MTTYARELAKDLRAEVARREQELDALRRALAAVENGSGQGRKVGRVSKSA